MISKKEVTKLVKNIARRDRGLADRRLIHPKREWGMIVIFCALGFFTGLGSAITAYSEYVNMEIEDDQIEIKSVTYDRGDVLDAIDVYREKAARYEAAAARMQGLSPLPTFDETVEAESVSTTTNDPSQQEIVIGDVPIMDRFPEKIVYGDNLGELDEVVLTAHCEREGGTFNSCGSVCSVEAEMCTEQCAFTCEYTIEPEPTTETPAETISIEEPVAGETEIEPGL